MFRRMLAAAGVAAALLTTPSAQAVPLAVDGEWTAFYFGEPGSGWLDAPVFDDAAQPFSASFTLVRATALRVTDLGLAGDRFALTLNGSLLGNTGLPAGGAADDAGMDAALASGSLLWSHGAWLLAPGDYVLTGVVLDSPYGAGVGALRLASVPEPAALLLWAAGLVGLGWAFRRRAARGEGEAA